MRCDINDCEDISVPAGLSGVVAITSSRWHNLALLGQGPPVAPAPLGNRTVLVGETAFFHMPAAGSHPLDYQWLCNGTNLPGATRPTLVLTNVQMEQAGQYSLRVQNAWGTLLHPGAALTVLPLLITNQPVSQSGFLGGTVRFTVQAQGRRGR